MTADVLVVGAGPAGSMAALTLARAGLRVRLLDRARFPRDKLCGDTVNPGALAILDRTGLGGAVRARALSVLGMTVTGSGVSVSGTYPDGLRGAALHRRDFDLLLVEAATRAGVMFDDNVRVLDPLLSDVGTRVTGIRVTGGERDCTLHARLVIAADGRGSRVASSLRLSRFARSPRRWAFGAYYVGVEGLSGYGEMHVGPHGYIGVAPVPGGAANVCVVRRDVHRDVGAADVGAAFRRPSIDMRRVITDAIANDLVLRERFRHAAMVSEVTVLGPLAIDSDGAGTRGLVLAGDAAGFVDPITGDGLRFALRGGQLAAEAALHELATGADAYLTLARTRHREFAGKWRLNRALRSLIDSPWALEYAAAVGRRWPRSIEYLIGAAGDVHLARPA